MKIKAIEKIVKTVLIKNVDARSDDFILIQKVCYEISPCVSHLPFLEVMMNHDYYGLPSFSSIVRARRKIFEECPNLRPNNKVTEKREELQEEYKEYARSKAV